MNGIFSAEGDATMESGCAKDCRLRDVGKVKRRSIDARGMIFPVINDFRRSINFEEASCLEAEVGGGGSVVVSGPRSGSSCCTSGEAAFFAVVMNLQNVAICHRVRTLLSYTCLSILTAL